MKNIAREDIVLDYLIKNRQIDLSEASTLLGVSESTARRVFNELQDAGKAFRTHGGIMLIDHPAYSFSDLLSVNAAEKNAIGRLAAAHIRSGDILYLDCGTTLFCLCQALADALRSGTLRDLQLFTNSLANMEVLAPHCTVNLIGGTYRPKRKDFVGFLSKSMVQALYFNRCFLGADGLGIPPGAGAMDFDTADLNAQVIARSGEVFVLCDSEKFRRTALVAYAQPAQIDWLITDGGIAPETEAACRQAGMRVLTAQAVA